MDYKRNFVSILTLGSFNPAILTPSFLEKQKIWPSDKKPIGKTTPVVSELKYGKVSFFTELERFQIMQASPMRFEDTPIIQAAYKYINKLRFTPLSLQGVNFNLNISEYKTVSGLQKIFDNPLAEIKNYIKSNAEYFLDTKSKVNGNVEETTLVNCKYYVDNQISVSINLRQNNTELILNYNYEVEGLDVNRERIDIIKKSYHSICDDFESFLKKLDD